VAAAGGASRDDTVRYRRSSRRVAKAHAVWTGTFVAVFALIGAIVCVGGLAHGDAAISVVGGAAALLFGIGGYWILGAVVRRPFEGELTSSGMLRLTSLAGTDVGPASSVRCLTRHPGGESSGPYFVLEWEHGEATLDPSLLVERLIDTNPALDVRRYSEEQRRRTRQRLGIDG